MLLTRQALKKILRDWRISIPAALEQELLDEYGNPSETDEEGHVFEYTEQDICEQLRKKLRAHENYQDGQPWSNTASTRMRA